jgi:hypothetical protein
MSFHRRHRVRVAVRVAGSNGHLYRTNGHPRSARRSRSVATPGRSRARSLPMRSARLSDDRCLLRNIWHRCHTWVTNTKETARAAGGD